MISALLFADNATWLAHYLGKLNIRVYVNNV